MEPTKEAEAPGNQVWWGASTHLELKGQGEHRVSRAMGAGDLEDAASCWYLPLAEPSGSMAQVGVSGGAQGRPEMGDGAAQEG